MSNDLKTEKQFRAELLGATLRAARASALTMMCARLFGKRRAMWKNHHNGNYSIYRIATWRDQEYLLGVMDV